MFSARTSWDTSEGSLAAAIRERRAAGGEVIDLTVSNPTVCGLRYNEEMLLGALRNPAGLRYEPDPRGIRSAREAVARYYAELPCAAAIDPDAVLLTTGTSEAYSSLFRLLCDAGDEVLVAQPSYPLFDFLSDLCDVRLVSYPLFYDFGWWLDFAELERRISPRTRAILLVHPNNPTGHATGAAERKLLEELCARHNLALIVDEVFLDYSLGAPIASFATGTQACLCFVVSGLSKIAALPQMKVGWLVALGPTDLRGEALNRLEVIADTYLSLSGPAQHALPRWLDSRAAIQKQILDRVQGNLAVLARAGLEVLAVEAGWSAVVRCRGSRVSDHMAEALVREVGVIVHPGSFYGLAAHRFVVLSVLVPQDRFLRGVEKLNKWMNPAE